MSSSVVNRVSYIFVFLLINALFLLLFVVVVAKQDGEREGAFKKKKI